MASGAEIQEPGLGEKGWGGGDGRRKAGTGRRVGGLKCSEGWAEGSEDSELATVLSPEARHLTRRWLGPEPNGAFHVSLHTLQRLAQPPCSLLVGRGERPGLGLSPCKASSQAPGPFVGLPKARVPGSRMFGSACLPNTDTPAHLSAGLLPQGLQGVEANSCC